MRMSASACGAAARAPIGPSGASRRGAISWAPTTREAFALEDRRRCRRADGCRRRETSARVPAARLIAPQSRRRSANSGRVIAPISATSTTPSARSVGEQLADLADAQPDVSEGFDRRIGGADDADEERRAAGGRPRRARPRSGISPPPQKMASGRASPGSLKPRRPGPRAACRSRARRPRAGRRRSAAPPPGRGRPRRRPRRAPSACPSAENICL